MSFIHESSHIDKDVKLGKDIKIWHCIGFGFALIS